MTHFTLEEWTDFIRALGTTQDGVMAAHAKTCPTCALRLATVRAVSSALDWDNTHEVPPHVLAKARALAHRLEPAPAREWVVARLVFDSGLRLAGSGIRSIGSGLRQMVFDAERFLVHVQWEHAPSGTAIALAGRISRAADSGKPENVRVTAVAEGVVAAEAITNEFGEFTIDCAWSPALTLRLWVPAESVQIEVPLAQLAKPQGRKNNP